MRTTIKVKLVTGVVGWTRSKVTARVNATGADGNQTGLVLMSGKVVVNYLNKVLDETANAPR